ncbi:putative ribonuclease H-like domain-containing protein [Tanacetum coccineum]
MVLRTVLTRTHKNVINNAYSTARKPFNKITAANNSSFIKKVNIVKGTRVNTARPKAVLSAIKGNKGNVVKASACWVWRPKPKVLDHVSRNNGASVSFKRFDYGNPQQDLKNKGVIDIGCSRHMTGNRSYLTDYEDIDGGFVAFGGNSKCGKITGKVLSPYFKLTDESHVLLKVPRKDNMYNVDLNNVVPQGGLTCLSAKATPDESNLWHRRLENVNFKTMNKLVKGNLVRGLPSKRFKINQSCVACQKGKQHRASCKTKTVSSISQPLQMLHMDLFGPTFVKSLMKKMYCLVDTDDFSIENLIDLRVKVIRCDNGTEFKNRVMNQFCEMKGIKREFSVARTPHKWSRKPALSFMRPFGCPVTILNTIDHLGKFDGKADEGFFVGYSTNSKAFRVFNSRTRIVEENLHVQFSENTPNIAGSGPNWLFDIDALTKSMNYKPVVAGNQSNGSTGTKACDNAGKARMETIPGKDYILLPLSIQDPPFSSMCKIRPFGCLVTILNTIYHLGKFDGKADEGFFVGYSINSKVFRVFNSRTRIVEENMHVQFSENTLNIARSGPDWLFDIDALTKSMNYKPPADPLLSQSPKSSPDDGFKPSEDVEKKITEEPRKEGGDSSKDSECSDQEKEDNVNNTNNVNAARTNKVNVVGAKTSNELPNDPNMPELEDIVYSDDDEDVGVVADMNNLDTCMPVSPIPTTRIHKDHPVEQIIEDLNSAPQTRRMTKNLEEHGLFSSVQQRTNHKDFQNCLFACFLSKEEPKKVWTLVDLPNGKRAISTKWVYKNKKDERGILIKNKARLVAQGYTQEKGIDYDEVFAPVARIEVLRLFLVYASFKDFVVYQMDVKSAFLYGKIEEEVYVCQPPGFEDPNFPKRRGKIDKTLFIKRDKGDILLVQVKDTEDPQLSGPTEPVTNDTKNIESVPTHSNDPLLSGEDRLKLTKLMELCTKLSERVLDLEKIKTFQAVEITKLKKRVKKLEGKRKSKPPGMKRLFKIGLQVMQKEDGIFISQEKYVNEILNKFGFSDIKTARTPMETQKALLKDANGEDVDEHLYRSMIGSFMYLTSSRPDIMFAVCACARFQVNPKSSHLHAVKRIFRYLKGQPKLCLWDPKDLPFDLVAYTDSDYAGASLDRKSTTGGCQFLRCRLISWQCKKQTMVANYTTEAKYIAASNCCGQVKTINREVQIQALVDKKKVIITETSVRSDLQLEDVEGTECLPNAIIFKQLTLMGYENLTQKLTFYKAFFSTQWKFLIHIILQCLSAKTTAWNEFGSTMASAVIYLATNQKFNFSKYICDNIVKNLEGGVKFLIYPRFVQVFLDKQVEGMSKYKEIYVTPSHTKKVFANMKRQGKDFFSRNTPLFPTMIVQVQEQSRRKQRKDNEDPQLSGPTEPITDDTKNVASVPTHSNDPLLSGEDRLKLNELMELCTILSQRVLGLEKTKTSQAAEITELTERVKRLENKVGSRTHRLRRLYKVGRSARVISSKDEEVTLVYETQGRYGDNLMFNTGVLENEQDMVEKEVDMAEKDVSTVDLVTTAGEVVNTANVVFSTAEVTTNSTTTTTVDELTLAQTLIEIKAAKPKARGVIVQEPSEFTTTTSPSQPSQLPQAKDKGKAKIVEPKKPLKKKDQIMFDKEVAQKLQAQLDGELEEEEKLVRQREEYANIAEWDNVQAMMDAAARLQTEEQRELTIEEKLRLFMELMNKRKKHFARLRVEEYKHNQLKTKSFEDIQMLFDKEMKRVYTFVDMDIELVKDENVEAEVDNDQEEVEMKKHMEIVPDDEVAIDAIPLATKPPIIIDWKIIKEGKMGYFQIIRADGSSKRPEEGYERVLWGDLKVMFEPDVEKKRYPLTPATITEMLNKKLQADHWNEMCYQLLKLMTKQLKNPGNV